MPKPFSDLPTGLKSGALRVRHSVVLITTTYVYDGEEYINAHDYTFLGKDMHLSEHRGVGSLRTANGDIIQLVPSDTTTVSITGTVRSDTPGTRPIWWDQNSDQDGDLPPEAEEASEGPLQAPEDPDAP